MAVPRASSAPLRRRRGASQNSVDFNRYGNGSVIDPTPNVLDLVRAESKYQDAMRDVTERIAQSKIAALNQVSELRAVHVKEIAAAETMRVNEQADLRTKYEERLASAEAKRIDAIRAVDVNAVAVAAQRASDQASVLSTQVTASAEQLRTQVAQTAETLRSLVATTAANAQTTLQQLVGPLSTRITTLEQAQYEGKGKSAYADPQLVELITKVDLLSRNQSVGAGKSEGVSSTMAMGIAIATLVLGAIGADVVLRPSSPSVSPQVVYVPAPAAAPKSSP